MTVDEARANINQKVIYDPGHGPKEEGVIASVGTGGRVFVRFGASLWARATYADMLWLLAAEGTR